MNLDIVVHAPGAGAQARAALPALTQAIFGDSSQTLMSALRQRLGPQGRFSSLRVIDAFGPNPGHPLLDKPLLWALKSLQVQGGGPVTLMLLKAPTTSPFAQIGGGQFSGQLSGTAASSRRSATSAGFNGGLSGNFGFGSQVVRNARNDAPRYLPGLQAAFGILKLEIVTNIQQVS